MAGGRGGAPFSRRELKLYQLDFEVEAEVALALVAVEESHLVVNDPGVADVLSEIDDLLVGTAEARIVGEGFGDGINFVDTFLILEVILFDLAMQKAVGKGK
jgi:hypothetical protein